jgi:hypothetical protein
MWIGEPGEKCSVQIVEGYELYALNEVFSSVRKLT